MMISSFQSDSPALPYVINLLGALTAEEITPRECVNGLRVAALDDSSKTLFYRTTWSKVKPGDVILVPGDGEPIVEVIVKEVHPLRTDYGEDLINIYYRFGYATYGIPCDPDGVAYVQSRL